ncbi:MAG: PLP-dependent aminotransferase family protein [Chloroflexota bacterium]
MPIPQLSLDPKTGPALYRQLADALEGAIASGTLAESERLPAERELAQALKVSRTTVVTAYRELEARGLVRGHVGRGTFVSARTDDGDASVSWLGRLALGAQRGFGPVLRGVLGTARGDTVSFGAGIPAPELFPVDLVRRLADQAMQQDPGAAFGIGATQGQEALRQVLGSRLGVGPDRILVVSGAQQGLDLVARCLIDPGDAVVVDRPGYLGAIQSFRAAGANLIGWDVERADTDELEDLFVRHRPKFLYTTPTFQNPTGRTLGLETRRELLRLAARHRTPIVEDDPCGELWFDRPPPPSLLALDDRGMVIYLGTASKTLGAGLRLGWVAAPRPIVEQLTLIKARTDLFANGLAQMVLTKLLGSAAYDRHLARVRHEHASRHAALAAALAKRIPTRDLSWQPVNGGLYLWCRLRGQTDSAALLERAQAAGVTFVPGEPFFCDGLGRQELRLCFSAVAPAAIEEGVRRLALALRGALDEQSSGHHAVV